MKDNRITVTDIPNTNLKKNYFEERLFRSRSSQLWRAPPSTFDAKQK